MCLRIYTCVPIAFLVLADVSWVRHMCDAPPGLDPHLSCDLFATLVALQASWRRQFSLSKDLFQKALF